MSFYAGPAKQHSDGHGQYGQQENDQAGQKDDHVIPLPMV
jgi:hypothetical protein